MELYRKDENGNISFWEIFESPSFTGGLNGDITIKHGKLGGKVITEIIHTNRAIEAEIKSRCNAKYKQGYKSIEDIVDNTTLPVKGNVYDYLNLYLPHTRTTAEGVTLPMLAKVYDNTNNKIFKDCSIYIGQWKINGLRCFIRAKETTDGFFHHTYFTFQSREGTFWNSLPTLNDYLLNHLPKDLIDNMIYDNWVLDGELYIPGLALNEINSAVKNINNPYNKHIQFWCYDIDIPDTMQNMRINELFKYCGNDMFSHNIFQVNHLNNTNKFVVLPTYYVHNDNYAMELRDRFINAGFEGLIMRNPNLEYEYGKRKMIKYKKSTDGKFTIVDIIPEGIKRPDIAKFVCRNDINNELFECKLSDTIDKQKKCLKNKNKYIGKILFIEYGERSGVNRLPFHIKNVRFNN